MTAEPVAPEMNLRSRYSYYVCGCCGKKVARGRKQCWFCGMEIDWKEREK